MRVRWPQPWLRNQVRISGSRRKWTDSFLWGSTRRACAQSGRITLESGSDATARSMSSSRSARTRRQSVLPLRAEANRFVIFLPLTSPCPPCGKNASRAPLIVPSFAPTPNPQLPSRSAPGIRPIRFTGGPFAMHRSVLLAFIVAGLAAGAWAQSGTSDLQHSELSAQVTGVFTRSTNNTPTTHLATNSAGLLVGYRVHLNSWQALEVEYGYTRNGQSYFTPATAGGASAIAAKTQTRGAINYGFGMDFHLFHIGARAEYQGLIFKVPDFKNPLLAVNKYTHVAQPSVGLILTF